MGCMYVLDGTRSSKTNAEQAADKESLYARLGLYVDDLSLRMIDRECRGDAHKSWALLCKRFGNQDKVRIHSIRKQLFRAEMEGRDWSVEEFITHVQELAAQCVDFGDNLSEEQVQACFTSK